MMREYTMEPVGKNNPSIQPSARNTEEGERFNKTLFAAIDTLEAQNIPYALIGGVAASGLGRPRSTHDIDIFVRPEDAQSTLEALGKRGFKTEQTDANWLFKAWNEGILVDIIFKSSGDMYFDEEMHHHSLLVEYHGKKVRAVSPEDLMIIKCAVHSEIGPHHWHDALAILSYATIDWDYLMKRSRRAPRRLLALLIYAQSNDILIPGHVIHFLFNQIYGGDGKPMYSTASTPASTGPRQMPHIPQSSLQPPHARNAYLSARIKDAFVRDQRIGDRDWKIIVGENNVLIRGEACSPEQLTAIEEVVRSTAPGFHLDNQLVIPNLPGPEGSEAIV